MSVQVAPSNDVSTLYPVIVLPLLFGAVHARSMFGELRVAVSPVVASGEEPTVTLICPVTV